MGANRTKVGLKLPSCATEFIKYFGANRTKVGLKPFAPALLLSIRPRANRTKVGLKLSRFRGSLG